jgi:ribosomal protein S6--L-glutamate ligase
MILSFHPCIDADLNLIVAGRAPGSKEKKLIKQADAVILPQGARQDLYDLCSNYCERVFPNYHHRFNFPGKIGDTQLFRTCEMPHPQTFTFDQVEDYIQRFPPAKNLFPFPFPFVLKGNYSGEGHLVFKILDVDHLQAILDRLKAMESSSMKGFMAQQWIDHGGRDVRVIVLFQQFLSYWRVQNDPKEFLTNLSAGGVLDRYYRPDLLIKAEEVVRRLCQQTGINLAGIDLMFNQNDQSDQPLFLEINYWFGRRFFGSSEAYYAELKKAIRLWLATFDLSWPMRVR